MAKRLQLLSFCALSGATLLAACGDGGGPVDLDKVYAVVQGTAYVDVNLDGRLTALVDLPAPGVATALLREGTSDTVARAVAGPDGAFRMRDVPIGRYTLVAGRGSIIGDSLQVMPIDSANIVLAANDTARREIRLSYATITIAALAQATGRRVSIEGVALNGYTTFGDSTVHLVDATGYTRAVRVQPVTINSGDSVRIFGAVGLDQGGRPVLLDGTAKVLAPGRPLPAVPTLTTAALATAANGARAYAQARITGATIEAIGVLAPTTGVSLGGDWQLKPRTPNELIITFPTVTVSAARAAGAGVKVSIEGLALNSWNVFGDSTVHLRDATGAIRGVRVAASNVAQGDSIRLLGTMGTRNGQPVVNGATATRLLAGVGLPEPDSVSTAIAASANAGRRDADQVRIVAPIVGTSTQPNQDLAVTVDDGSGQLVVIFDRNVGFNTSSLVPGAILTARGVLVPTGTGSWRLLPRAVSDFSAVYPTVTIANARTLPAGKIVYIYGIALNEAAAFTTPVVHVADATGAIRVLQVSPIAGISAGDSVRVLGTVSFPQGQPAINASSAEIQLLSARQVTPVTLSTVAASRADGGTRDAALVRTRGTIKAVRSDPFTSDQLLDVDDGSGNLVVRLDTKVGFTGPWNVNDTVDVTGVLSPAGDGTWVLKPRRLTDVTVTPGG